jgi:hypothetical protein
MLRLRPYTIVATPFPGEAIAARLIGRETTQAQPRPSLRGRPQAPFRFPEGILTVPRRMTVLGFCSDTLGKPTPRRRLTAGPYGRPGGSRRSPRRASLRSHQGIGRYRSAPARGRLWRSARHKKTVAAAIGYHRLHTLYKDFSYVPYILFLTFLLYSVT